MYKWNCDEYSVTHNLEPCHSLSLLNTKLPQAWEIDSISIMLFCTMCKGLASTCLWHWQPPRDWSTTTRNFQGCKKTRYHCYHWPSLSCFGDHGQLLTSITIIIAMISFKISFCYQNCIPWRRACNCRWFTLAVLLNSLLIIIIDIEATSKISQAIIYVTLGEGGGGEILAKMVPQTYNKT